MKLAQTKNNIPDSEGEKLEAEVRAMAGRSRAPDLPQAYWSNLIVRANERIDRATDVGAISISWAARVAIPGVVAIISFLIGLHYYVPAPPQADTSLTSVILALPDSTQDSLLVNPSGLDPALTVEEIGANLFEASPAAISDYLMSRGDPKDVMDVLTDQEANQVLAAIATEYP